MPGLLGEDDNGATDLGTLERRLAERNLQSTQASQVVSSPTSPSQATSGRDGQPSSPGSALTSPEPVQDGEKQQSVGLGKEKHDGNEVSELSEMMCSLVTNNCGETRYIGTLRHSVPRATPILSIFDCV